MTAGRVSASAHFSVSETGMLVYLTGRDPRARTLVWVDRNGREEAIAAEPRGYTYPRVSPEGGRLALDVRDESNDIWVWNFARETLNRLTVAEGRDAYPVWTPDARLMAVAVETEPDFFLGRSEELFGGYYAPRQGAVGRTYDIAHDGERFLMIKESAASVELHFVLNWYRELERLVPTK